MDRAKLQDLMLDKLAEGVSEAEDLIFDKMQEAWEEYIDEIEGDVQDIKVALSEVLMSEEIDSDDVDTILGMVDDLGKKVY